ncbi:trypsin-like peptidase domain-containing protein [Luteolibacter algae]|uniref:Trypsin-like peptidase domain-containing protein n=1 Tax=Luteolibacter algae TaxID=454151 RepID=A0ABW5D7D1_9BACT
MVSALKRFFALLIVFVSFFLLVTALKTWRTGGDFSMLIPSFLRRAEVVRPEAFTPSDKPALNLSDVEIISRLNEEYARLTRAVVPSVVSIDTAGVRTERLMDFWGRSRIRSYPTQGQGSGVIVSREGHVITNHHVIAGQQQIRITLHGGKTYNATMVGEDSLLDIAVVKIDSDETFVPLKLGDSSKAEVGQLVFAVGNPFGLGETVTQGIISAKERSLSDNQRDLFQTDAAINPGNSGGPLVNLTGEIIGINAAIFSVDKENPSFQGVGFSIPSNEVKEALEQIIKRGRPIRGFLGVQMRDLDEMARADLGYTKSAGSAVVGITPNSPAEKAGLKPRDVVESFGGTTITDTRQLISLVQRTKIGTKMKLHVWREGKVVELEATISESTGTPQSTGQVPEISKDKEIQDNLAVLRAMGINVRDLSAKEQLRGFRGVVVTALSETGKASEYLLPGDLIIALNNSQISTANEFYLHLAASAAVQATSLHLIRDGKPLRMHLPALGK